MTGPDARTNFPSGIALGSPPFDGTPESVPPDAAGMVPDPPPLPELPFRPAPTPPAFESDPLSWQGPAAQSLAAGPSHDKSRMATIAIEPGTTTPRRIQGKFHLIRKASCKCRASGTGGYP